MTLVDEGWQGQDAFAGLAFDLGRASGLLTEAQTQQLKGRSGQRLWRGLCGVLPVGPVMNEEELLREARIRSVAEPEERPLVNWPGSWNWGRSGSAAFCRRWRWWPPPRGADCPGAGGSESAPRWGRPFPSGRRRSCWRPGQSITGA